MDLETEKKLVEKAKGSLDAFDRLYEHYLPRIYAYILNRTNSKETAEDITSQTFMKAMTKIQSFQYRGYTFGAWLYRVAHNCLIDHFRKKKLHSSYEDMADTLHDNDPTPSPSEEIERQRVILEALRKIPPQYQEVLSLKFFENLTNDEMADILGCKKNSLAVKIHRSMKSLEKVLLHEGYDYLVK